MSENTTEEQAMQSIMGLIVNAGNARAFAKEAIDAAHQGDFKTANEKLDEANKALVDAHNSQTAMLTKEASGEHIPVTLLLVHSQDHLMTAITYIDLAKELVAVYEKMAQK
ncbi:PTS lactose/cellobiose transporter subunit IIA [Lactobacillus sp.]|uniref:PTS lactose/cellobiose transporter subunit IIA n=1 Tax=Lactobacillus sp. TaxID=1591 RepID=UPI003EF614A0